MSVISDFLSSPTLWAGAATGSLFSAVITGFFTRSTTRASDDRKAAADRSRIELEQVRDAALNFLSVCDEVFAEIASYDMGVADPTSKYREISEKTDFENAIAYAIDTDTRISLAANRLILIAPPAIAEAVWPVQFGLKGMIPHPSFKNTSSSSQGAVYRKYYNELLNAIRTCLDIPPVDHSKLAAIIGRLRQEEFKQQRTDEAKKEERAARSRRHEGPEVYDEGAN